MNTSNKVTVKVAGMSCPHCEATVKRNLEALEGIYEVEASHKNQEVNISGSNVDLEKVKETIDGLGYKFLGP